MPKLPWKTVGEVDPGAECTVMGSRLPLRHYRHVLGFMRWTMKIRRQLAGTEGLLGYALDAQIGKKTFWTVSAWSGRDHLRRFDRADPHHEATEAIRPRMLPSTFVFWTATAKDLPIAWDEVRQRIEAAPGGAATP
jgi:hypothetical protein